MAQVRNTKMGRNAAYPASELLAVELERLNVPFLLAGNQPFQSPLTPVQLISGLASSDEARLQMALIPLFLSHPELGSFAEKAVEQISAKGRISLMCYYSAAYLLQKRETGLLVRLGLPSLALRDLFMHRLGLSVDEDVLHSLNALAARHAQLSQQPVNWLGTYEHTFTKFILFQERQAQWKA